MARRNPHFQPDQPHHTPDGFRNVAAPFEVKSLADVLRWRWNARAEGLPKPPQAPIPQVPPDVAWLHANATAAAAMVPAVTWVGHATVLAQLGGLNVLTDPIFAERASPVSFVGPRREQPPGLSLAQLPHIDVVMVSHNHYDHLCAPSVRALAAQAGGPPRFVVPLGLKAWFAKLGIHTVDELDWWQSVMVSGACGRQSEVMLVPAQHWSARGIADRMATLWGGFAMFAPDCHLFFAGDTAYSREFATLKTRFAERQQAGGFDIALLPIGAYEPRWFMAPQHVNVEEALRIHHDLGAQRSLGVHWGTFALTDEPLDEPPRELQRLRAAQNVSEDAVFVLPIGGTRVLPARRG